MTSPRPSHVKRRANFGDWYTRRPFWGGLFLLLSGLELFLSANLQLALEVHFGPTGFLSYVLPSALVLCGLLTWFSPDQRLFYGIVGILTALYSLIGLNLGGFFAGTLLGLLGGGLAVSWVPGAPAVTDPQDAPPAAEQEYPAYERAPLDELLTDEPSPESLAGAPSSGVLTDTLPFADRSPLHAGAGDTDTLPFADRSPLHAGAGDTDTAAGSHADPRGSFGGGRGGAGDADQERPPAGDTGQLPKRRGLGLPLFALLLTGTVAAASLYGATRGATPVFAAPAACGTAPAKPGTGTGSAPAPGQTSAAAPASPSLAASPSPAKTEDKPGLFDWLGGLFGGGKKAEPAPTQVVTTPPVPSNTTATAPAPKGSATATGTKAACPTAGASATPNNKKAQLAAGQPFVASNPSILIANEMTMDGLTYDGVVDLPKKDGTKVKVLAFSMKKSVSTPFELRTSGLPKLLLTKSSKLTVEGNVKFYTSKFSAKVLGILPLTFTPSFPPPPIPLPGYYTDCNIELVFVQSNVLTAPNLSIAYAS